MPMIKIAKANKVITMGVLPQRCKVIGQSMLLKIKNNAKATHQDNEATTDTKSKRKPTNLSATFTIPPIRSAKKSKKFLDFFF